MTEPKIETVSPLITLMSLQKRAMQEETAKVEEVQKVVDGVVKLVTEVNK